MISQKKRNAMRPMAATPPTAPPTMAPRGAEPLLLSLFPPLSEPGGGVLPPPNLIVEVEVRVKVIADSSLEEEELEVEVELSSGDA